MSWLSLNNKEIFRRNQTFSWLYVEVTHSSRATLWITSSSTGSRMASSFSRTSLLWCLLIKCLSRLSRHLKRLPQSEHRNVLASEWTAIWYLSLYWSLRILLQIWRRKRSNQKHLICMDKITAWGKCGSMVLLCKQMSVWVSHELLFYGEWEPFLSCKPWNNGKHSSSRLCACFRDWVDHPRNGMIFHRIDTDAFWSCLFRLSWRNPPDGLLHGNASNEWSNSFWTGISERNWISGHFKHWFFFQI